MLEIYSFFYIVCSIMLSISMYFYLSFYNRLMFIFLIIFKRNTNSIIYLVNQLHHHTIYTDNLIIKNFELPSSYCLQLLHLIKYFCYVFDQMYHLMSNCCCYIYHILNKNKNVKLYIEHIEKEMEHYNVIYLNRRDELLNKLFQSVMSNVLELVKNNKSQERNNNNNKYKNNIKGTINKLKRKKIN